MSKSLVTISQPDAAPALVEMGAKSTRSVHPVAAWSGQWVWTRKHLTRPWNYFAYFRKTVTLPSKPREAIVRVSAQARYTLYVNGTRVHHGPARSFPRFQSYDTLDLTNLLQEGLNTLGAICHEYGVPTFYSQFRDISGFLLDGQIDLSGEDAQEPISLSTPDGWVSRPALGWRREVVRMSLQMGFQEHFDADADPTDWMLPAYDATEQNGWSPVFRLGPVGMHPWLTMETRSIPLLADHMEFFTQVVAQFTGENARGYKISEDVYHLPLQETRKREKLSVLENAQAMLQADDGVTTVAVADDSQFIAAVLDLGAYRTGHFILDIADASGDEIIDIIYGEELDKTQFPLIVTSTDKIGCEEATATRYRCRPGSQKWETFHYVGMRYVAVIFRNVQKPLQIRAVAVRQVHAAIEDVGTFECSDAQLSKIWSIARETQRNCLFDAFVDCPWREQAQWWGDARVQGRVTAHAFGDVTVLQRGIRQVAQSQGTDGSLHAHPPADSPMHRLPDFMLTWVGTLWDDYQHTGRTDLIRACLPTLHRLFEFFAEHELVDGLVGRFDGWWVFLDWVPLPKGDLSGVLNLMYLQALRWAAELCRIGGDTQAADRYGAHSEVVAGGCIKYFWDETAQHWRDGYDVSAAKLLESTSQHMHALAILLDLKPDTHAALARDYLIKPARARRAGKVITASSFFYAYVLEALIKTGNEAAAIGIIRDKWGSFLDRNAVTFWENFTTTRGSFCHAWSSSPLYLLMQIVLGVRSVAPGWQKVRIAPKPAGVDFARGVVPTPLGNIHVEWERAGDDQWAVRVDLPEGMEANFVDAAGAERQLVAGPNEFHT